ncbi:MAG: hypothetical protein LBV41_11190 [Cytophagaceae bacterium]|jgi:hypothetical protein|nr:hypothetical protein [Cytophagaceae bacterium]
MSAQRMQEAKKTRSRPVIKGGLFRCNSEPPRPYTELKIELGKCRLNVRIFPHGNKTMRKGVLPDALTVIE